MKKIALITFLSCNLHAMLFAAADSTTTSPRVTVSINRDWTFQYFPAQTTTPASASGNSAIPMPQSALDYDDSAWRAIAIPHTWSTYETTGALHPYIRDANEKQNPYWWRGWGWYRKHFSIDASQAGRKVFIEFDGVQKYCRVYLNGEYLTEHKGGFHSFSIDLTDRLRFGTDNVLAVAVSNQQADENRIPPMDAGNWDLYGGIYRNTRLVITDRIYVPFQGNAAHEGGMTITTPEASSSTATVSIRTWVKNDDTAPRTTTLVTTILAPDNITAVFTGTTTATLQPGELRPIDTTATISTPQLWSPETPQLYTARCDVFAASPSIVNRKSEIVIPSDSYASPFGIRTLRWKHSKSLADNILYVNDRPVNLQGFIRHQEYPWLGDAMPDWVQLLDLRDMKENLNCNLFRSGHYTTDRVVYDYCDRNGLLVVEDVPNVKDKNFNRTVQEQQVREMVRRDRNRPSIFAWSMGDESNKAADSKWAHEEDPTRLVHARDCAPPATGDYITLPAKELRLGRLMSCTVRGWSDNDIYPHEPANHQITGNEERQHLAALGTPNTQGGGEGSDGAIRQRNLAVWLYEDHGCDRTYQNEPILNINPKGWVDAYRFPKYAYYLWQANHNTAPMLFIHPHNWTPQYIGQQRDITIDSNCDTVELRIDDRAIATLKPALANSYCVTFKNVPVTNATLTAIGKKIGAPAITTALPMPGAPARITLAERHETLEAALDTVAIITADIVDAASHHVTGAVNTLHWSIEGPATLVGAPVYETDINKNMARDGVMYTATPITNIIRSTGEPGEVTVRVQSAGLALGEIKLTLTPRAPAAPGPVTQPAITRASGSSSTGVPPVGLSGMGVPPMDGPAASGKNATTQPELTAYRQITDQLTRNSAPAPSPAPADLTFNTANYARACEIAAYLQTTALPPAFLNDLRAYYARQIITLGNTRTLDEIRAPFSTLTADTPLTLVTVTADDTDARALLTRQHPAFAALDATKQEAALTTLCRINPWVTRTQHIHGDRKTNNVTRVVTYTATPDRTLLIPTLDWLLALSTEPAPAKTPDKKAARPAKPKTKQQF